MWGRNKCSNLEEVFPAHLSVPTDPMFESQLMTNIGNLGLVDDTDINFDESDMNDPDLLSAFHQLGPDEEGATEVSTAGMGFLKELNTHTEYPIEPRCTQLEVQHVPELPPENLTKKVTLKSAARTAASPTMTDLDRRLISVSHGNQGKKVTHDVNDIETLRQKAVFLKNSGRMDEAISCMRQLKALEGSRSIEPSSTVSVFSNKKIKTLEGNSIFGLLLHFQTHIFCKGDSQGQRQSMPTKPLSGKKSLESISSPLSTLPSFQWDQFTPLENAINEAMSENLRLAKALKETAPAEAATRFRKYKNLKEELNVIASRRQVEGALPPLFSWKTTSREIQVEDTTLADDQIRVVVERLSDLESILEGHRSRAVSVVFSTGIVKDPITSETSTVNYVDSDRAAVFNCANVFTFRRRGAESQIARKKATFDVVLHRGFFKSDITIASAKLPLDALLSKGTIGGDISLTESGGRKCVGGTLRVRISLRKPISGKEVRVETSRELEIAEWPVSSSVSSRAKLCQESNHDASIENGVEGSSNDPIVAKTESLPSSTISYSKEAFSTLSEMEKSDPHNVQLLVSNDVLEAELELANAEKQKALSEEEMSDVGLRIILLNAALTVLVSKVQGGDISLTQYIDSLNTRIVQDKLIAVYCSTFGSKKDAIRVMRRIRIMENEVKGAIDMENNVA